MAPDPAGVPHGTAAPMFSIVVPVYNGAATLPRLFDAVAETMAAVPASFEVIFVDDGSADESWRVILELAARPGAAARGFQLARNSGQQAATYCGLLEAAGTWVVTIDDDLQPHPREILKLWACAAQGRADVVFGVYDTLRHGWLHRVGTRLFRSLLGRIAPAFPNGSSFRLIRGAVLRTLPRVPGPGLLVDPLLAWQTSALASVTVEHQARPAGASGYSLATLIGIAWEVLMTYSRLPLRVMTVLGLMASVASFGLGLYYLFQKVTVGAQLGFSAIIVTTAFASGVILLSLGVLGEYISRLHRIGTGEPAFVVKARASADAG